jgi:uncharacterized repeat protein (TIGR03847 family)
MTRLELNLDPLEHITADAIGQPGQRVFYLQGWRETDPKPVTVIIEKIQLQNIAIGLEQMVQDLAKTKPELAVPEVDYDPDKMRIHPPVDPLFRAGEMGLGYELERDRIILLVRELLLEGADPEQGSTLRFWCTRAQARQLAAWAEEVIERGRPTCPQCGEPMEPEGHFCPKKNGNKKH